MGVTSIVLTLTCLRLQDPGFGKWDTEAVRASVHERAGAQGDVAPAEAVDLRFFEIYQRLLLIKTLRRVFACFVLIGVLLGPYLTYISFFLDQRWDMGAGARGLFAAFYASHPTMPERVGRLRRQGGAPA